MITIAQHADNARQTAAAARQAIGSTHISLLVADDLVADLVGADAAYDTWTLVSGMHRDGATVSEIRDALTRAVVGWQPERSTSPVVNLRKEASLVAMKNALVQFDLNLVAPNA